MLISKACTGIGRMEYQCLWVKSACCTRVEGNFLLVLIFCSCSTKIYLSLSAHAHFKLNKKKPSKRSPVEVIKFSVAEIFPLYGI